MQLCPLHKKDCLEKKNRGWPLYVDGLWVTVMQRDLIVSHEINSFCILNYL